MNPHPKPQQKEKLKTCKNCKAKFKPKGFNQKFCMVKDECIKLFVEKEREKKIKADKRAWNIEKKERKDKAKTSGNWRKDLQDVVNAIARELDKDLPCISHPEMNDNTYDGGHFWPVSAHGSIRYNIHNIHKQCKRANKEYGGGAAYATGLLERYGKKYFLMVADLPKKYDLYGKKFTIKNIREEYLPNASKVLRELKGGAEFTRDQVNEMIGIYEK